MPKVPVAEGFGVLPGVRQGQARPVLSQDAATLPGRQMEQFGQQMGAVGQQIGEYALKEQEKINKARLNEAYNQADKLSQDLRARMRELQGAEAAKGIDGRPLDAYFDDELKRGLSTIADDLQAPVVREQFALLADDMATRFRGDAISHLAEQSAIYQKNVRDATAVQSFNNIASDPFKPGVVEFNIARARDAYTETFRDAGFDESSGLEEQVKGAMGKSHSVVIDTLLEQGRGVDAKAYFDQHRDDFNAADAEMVSAKVSKGASAAQALVDVDAVLGEFQISGDNIPRSKMDARLRELVGDDPIRLKAARDELTIRMNLYEEEYNNQYADNYDAALRLAQTSPARAYASPAFQALDAKDQETIRTFVTGRADDARSDRQTKAYYDIVYAAGGPQALATMPDAEFRNLRQKVGEANFGNLLKLRTDIQRDPTRVLEISLDNDQFNRLASDFGIDPLAKGANKTEVSRLRATMDDLIDAEQSRLGRKLSRQEKDVVIRQAFASEVQVRSGWWGKTSVPVPMLTPEQMQKVTIPPDDRKQISAALQTMYEKTGSAAYVPSEENLRRVYLETKGADLAGE